MSALLQMQTFLEIIDRGSLSAAARALATVPSTVSARLVALEDRLGTRLVVRSTRSLRLTDEGERYLVDCRRIVDEIERTEACIRNREGSLTGQIRITAPSDLGRGKVRHVVDEFIAGHPRVDVHLQLTDELVDLERGGFDIALRVGRLPTRDLVARTIARGHRVVCATPEYWARHGRPTRPAELLDHDCLLWTSDGRNEAGWTFGGPTPQTIRVRGRRSSNDGDLVRAWALAGLGVAYKSRWDIARDLEAGRLETALDAFAAEADLHVVVLRQRLSRRVRSLVDHLIDRLR